MGHEGTGKINTRVERVFKSKKMNNVQKRRTGCRQFLKRFLMLYICRV